LVNSDQQFFASLSHARGPFELDHSSFANGEKAMPVKLNLPTAKDYAATDSRFDACVRRLAPIIRHLREDSAQRSTRKLTERLNAMGQVGPNGKKLTFSTTRRILLRLPQLHLGDGPSDWSRAARDRRTPYYPRLTKSNSNGMSQLLADVARVKSQ
jgi:hypothetical protein